MIKKAQKQELYKYTQVVKKQAKTKQKPVRKGALLPPLPCLPWLINNYQLLNHILVLFV